MAGRHSWTAKYVVDAHYDFEEGTGTLVADSAGSNDGTASGMTWGTGGKVGGFGIFDGSNDVVNITDTSIFTQSAFTIVASIDPDDITATYQAIFSHYSDGTSSDPSWRMMIRGPSNTIELIVLEDTSNYITATAPTSTISTGSWYSIACVWDGGFTSTAGSVFVDGVNETTVQNEVGNFTAINNSAEVIRIGGSETSESASDHYNGDIGVCLFYARVLNPVEIAFLANYQGVA